MAQTQWWRGAVIYQVYPRSFQDTTGNGIGDLAGITARLDHVADLGADAIWLSPVFRSPMADMGYDVSDYCDIDPLFGTLADFDALVARAHDLGLKVIIDQVLSHSSDRHPWFAASRQHGATSDWYVWADPKPDGTPPNNWQSNFGGSAWEYAPDRRQYYLHNFLPSQPDLNVRNPVVQDALMQVLDFWLARGVDGFRLDAINHCIHDGQLRDNPAAEPAPIWPPASTYDMQKHLHDKSQPEMADFLRRIRTTTNHYPNSTTMGEIGDVPGRTTELMAEYTSGGDKLHMAYSFDMLGPHFTAAHFRETIEGFFTAAPDGWPCWSFSNHDVNRHVSRWRDHGAADDIARQAIAMLASFRGTLCLYQGEELGQTETELSYDELTDPPGLRFWPENKGRDGCRTPMVWDDTPNGGFTTGRPWLPVKAPQAARHAAGQRGVAESVLNYYRQVLALRRAMPALRTGDMVFLDLPEPVLGFARDGMTCLFNLGPDPVTLARPAGNPTGPCLNMTLHEDDLHLGPNAVAWFA